MPELKVTLDDGTTAPLAKCDWVFREPCGCPRGVMMAVIGSTVLHDEDTAFLDFFREGDKRKAVALVKRERARGVTAELVTHERYRAEVAPAMLKRCPHKTGAVSA
jgi:hypothetical protein